MNIMQFAGSRMGGSHIKSGKPCQDASASFAGEGWSAAVVADGHGSSRHFRSEYGSQFACQAAQEALNALFAEGAFLPGEEEMHFFKENILNIWRDKVVGHVEQNPWTPDELLDHAELGCDSIWIPYGSTVILAAAGEDWWFSVQLGDGDVALLGEDGKFSWPMPPSMVNVGNKTASLCMDDPMFEFRHVSGTQKPAGIIVYTDGIEKSFSEHGKNLADFLYVLWNIVRTGHEDKEHILMEGLRRVAEHSPVKDDVSAAGLVWEGEEIVLDSADIVRAEMQSRLNAEIAECRSTIRYNMHRLSQVNELEDLAAVERLRDILARKRRQLADLCEQAGVPMEEGDMAPDGSAEEAAEEMRRTSLLMDGDGAEPDDSTEEAAEEKQQAEPDTSIQAGEDDDPDDHGGDDLQADDFAGISRRQIRAEEPEDRGDDGACTRALRGMADLLGGWLDDAGHRIQEIDWRDAYVVIRRRWPKEGSSVRGRDKR